MMFYRMSFKAREQSPINKGEALNRNQQGARRAKALKVLGTVLTNDGDTAQVRFSNGDKKFFHRDSEPREVFAKMFPVDGTTDFELFPARIEGREDLSESSWSRRWPWILMRPNEQWTKIAQPMKEILPRPVERPSGARSSGGLGSRWILLIGVERFER
jgi:hypothetical protein